MSDDGTREVRFKMEHYDLLMKCAKKRDMTEWNEWYQGYKKARKDAGEEDCGAWLEGAYLREAYLEGADLEDTILISAHLEKASLTETNLKRADMPWVHLEGAYLMRADLEGANMCWAHLERTILSMTHLKGAFLSNTNLKHAILSRANLEGVDMSAANLAQAYLQGAHLEGANMSWANLEGAFMTEAHLEGASFHAAWLNEKTDLLGCTYDTETDFTATSLTSTHIEPDTLTSLQKNIRRKYWMRWYGQHRILQHPVCLFWWFSDYGTTCTRCIGAFVLLIIAAFVTYFWITGIAIPSSPELFADTILATFGFGGLYDQLAGPVRLLLAAHVLAGYFLLAVLITRFAVMFQSLTP